ncbi:hypothetical protein MADA3029_910030 [Vibrio nigripulchritudo MADA3029]|nr:hypothetical protein VIBNIMADA3020_810031 [Vibrio nigripulchritudo MADA3020]CCN56475.1 hypothetical protein VIBNIMADA3021_950086 [Vibrio nigripulchritudo MADA3021]CCN62030.1 hypothetical protein MADA3029_910030 [Vibrio nigripulchritudo MADA3029]
MPKVLKKRPKALTPLFHLNINQAESIDLVHLDAQFSIDSESN